MTSAPCAACQAAATDPHSGLYRTDCLDCCIRLVLAAHPDRRRAAGMLAFIERRSPCGRDRVLAGVRAVLASGTPAGASAAVLQTASGVRRTTGR